MKTEPDKEGFWWMYDPNAYGWTPVEVSRSKSLNRFVYHLIGVTCSHNISDSDCWIELEKPNINPSTNRIIEMGRKQE